jgi:hypothetical protein
MIPVVGLTRLLSLFFDFVFNDAPEEITTERNTAKLRQFNKKYKPEINSDETIRSMCGFFVVSLYRFD